MTFGLKVPKGFLPVYSVGTKKEAQELIVLACSTNMRGEYIAPELAREQTLENLEAFSNRLDRYHEILKANGHCTCRGAAATEGSR